ncbi:MAG: aromatic ring-hydroxylating oxygenase subunit alpha [Candidatus Binataceae bacterium]
MSVTTANGVITDSGARAQSEVATRIPYSVFLDNGVYALEQDRLFRGPVWNFLALEAEVANPGDYRANFIGETPVFVSRDRDGALHTLINRCAHRGSMVCRETRGNAKTHVCPYHQWSYDLAGKLLGVPFKRGIDGKGGYSGDFDLAAHSMREIRTAVYRGLVFASFSDGAEPIEDYLGQTMRAEIDRVFNRPVRVLGFSRQFINGNWKVYVENVKDPYHGSLLHLFHATFGSYRSSQSGGMHADRFGRHSHIAAFRTDDANREVSAFTAETVGSYAQGYKLADPSLLKARPEFGNLSTSIQFIFPNLVIQQISNTLAARQIIPRGVDKFELLVTYFGYQDDDEEMATMRLKQSNLIGPAGYIALEDGYAVELVQQAIQFDGKERSFIELGGRGAEDQDNLVTETAIRAFWNYYAGLMGFRWDESSNGRTHTNGN